MVKVYQNTLPCTVPGCEKLIRCKGLCTTHYERWKKHKNLDRQPEWRNPNGVGHINKAGYRQFNVKGKDCLEHRQVMSESLGRPLFKHETVHHLNGDRLDNRIENLELWSSRQPKGQRVEDKIIYAIEILSQYKPELLK